MFLTNYLITIIIVAVGLQNSNSKLNFNAAMSTYQLIAELLDAFDRQDYVDVWIKLIDLKLQLNPPSMFSKEMIQLLMLRRRLVKFHKYYLIIHPSRIPVNDFSNNYDSNWITEQDITPILNVFNAIAQETSSLLGDENKIEDNPDTSDDQIYNIFTSIVNNLIKTTEDSLSTNIPEVGKEDNTAPNLSNDLGVINEKPLVGAPAPNNITFSEETNNAICNSMMQLSNLIESAPRPDQSNITSTVKTNDQTTINPLNLITTTDSSNNSSDTAVNDPLGSLFSILNVLANPDQISSTNNTINS